MYRRRLATVAGAAAATTGGQLIRGGSSSSSSSTRAVAGSTADSLMAAKTSPPLTPAQRIDLLLEQYHERGVGATHHTIASRSIGTSFAHGGSKAFYESLLCQQATRRAVVELYDTLPPFDDRGLSRVLSFTLSPDPGGAAHDTPDLSSALANDRILLQMMLIGRRFQIPTIHLALAAANFAGVASHHMAKMIAQVEQFPGIPPVLQRSFFVERIFPNEKITVEQTKPDVFVRMMIDAWITKRHDKARDIVDAVTMVHEGNNILRALSVIRRHPEVFPSTAPTLLDLTTRVAAIVDSVTVHLRQSRSLSHEIVKRTVAREAIDLRALPPPIMQEQQIRANTYILHIDALRRLTSRLRSTARRAKDDAGENRHFESVHAVELAKVAEEIRDVSSLYATWAYAAKAAVTNESLRLSNAITLADQLERLKIQVQKASEYMSVLIRVNNIASGKRLTKGSQEDTSNPRRIILDMRNKSHGCMSAIHQCRYDIISMIPFAQRGQVIASVGRAEEDESDKVVGHTPSRTGRVGYFVPHTALRILLDAIHEFVVHANANAGPVTRKRRAEQQAAAEAAAEAARRDPDAAAHLFGGGAPRAADNWDDDAFGDATDKHGDSNAAAKTTSSGDASAALLRFDGLPPMHPRNCQHTSPVDDAALLRSIEAIVAQHFPVNNVTATARFNWLRLVANVASDPHFFATIPKGKIISMSLAVELFIRHEASLQQRHARQGLMDSFSFANGVLESLSRFPHSPETAEVVRRCAHTIFAVSTADRRNGITLIDHRSAAKPPGFPPSPSAIGAAEDNQAATAPQLSAAELEEHEALFAHVTKHVGRASALQLLQGSTSTTPNDRLLSTRHRTDSTRAVLRNVTFALTSIARSHVNRRADIDLRNAVPQCQIDELIDAARVELARVPDIRSFGLILYAAARLSVPYEHLQATVRAVVNKAVHAPKFFPDGRLIPLGPRASADELEMFRDPGRGWFSLSELCTVVDALNIMQCTDRVVVDRLIDLHGVRAISDAAVDKIAEEQETIFGPAVKRAARHEVWGAELYSALEHSFDMGSIRPPLGLVSRAQFTRLRRLARRATAGRPISFAEAMANTVGIDADERLYRLSFIRNSIAMPRSRRADADPAEDPRDEVLSPGPGSIVGAATKSSSSEAGDGPSGYDVPIDPTLSKPERVQLRNQAIIRAREQKLRAQAAEAAKSSSSVAQSTRPRRTSRPGSAAVMQQLQQSGQEWQSPVTKMLRFERRSHMLVETDHTPRVPTVKLGVGGAGAGGVSERAAAFEKMMDEEKARRLGITIDQVRSRNPDVRFTPPPVELVQVDPEAAGPADTSKRRVVARPRRSSVRSTDSE